MTSEENSIGHIPEGLLKDAMSTVLPVQGVGGGHPLNGSPMSSLTKPRLEIVEQPKSNRSSAQRSSAGPLRSVLIVCVLAILVLSVLYFMKRVEANKLNKDLQLLKEVSSLQTRLTTCEDEKGNSIVEKGKVETELKECQSGKTTYQQQAQEAQAQLQQTKTSHETVSSRLKHVQSDMTNVQAALTDAENELEECETENTQCQHSLASFTQQMNKCKQGKDANDQLVTNLQSNLQSLQSQVVSLQSQLQNAQRSAAVQPPPQPRQPSYPQMPAAPPPPDVPHSPVSYFKPLNSAPQMAVNSSLQTDRSSMAGMIVVRSSPSPRLFVALTFTGYHGLDNN